MRSNRRRNVFWITLRRLGRRQARNYCSATLLDFCARSRSITARQPVLRLARFFIMQAVIFGIFGISSLQSLKASPVHICCASELKAKLEVADAAENETAMTSAMPAWRMVLVKVAVMSGSCWPGSAGPLLMTGQCLNGGLAAVTSITQKAGPVSGHSGIGLDEDTARPSAGFRNGIVSERRFVAPPGKNNFVGPAVVGGALRPRLH